MRIRVGLHPDVIDTAARIIAEHRTEGLHPYTVIVTPGHVSVQSGVSPHDYTSVLTTLWSDDRDRAEHLSGGSEWATLADAAAAARSRSSERADRKAGEVDRG